MSLRKTVQELDKKYHDRQVVLVDSQDREIGTASLVSAHRDKGLQHRAFSLQLYRTIQGHKELLLQQRAADKPVFPFYWANTCCYNMAPGEEYLSRAVSRAREEMGIFFDEKILQKLYKFTYYAPDIEGWCENELDTVIVGQWDGQVVPDPSEAMEYKWISWAELKSDVDNRPDIYAPWFKLIINDPRFRQIFE